MSEPAAAAAEAPAPTSATAPGTGASVVGSIRTAVALSPWTAQTLVFDTVTPSKLLPSPADATWTLPSSRPIPTTCFRAGSAPPRYPPSTGTASPASRLMPTRSGSVGSARSSSAQRCWNTTAARTAWRVEPKTHSASSPRSSTPAVPGLDHLARHLGEPGGQPCRGLVPCCCVNRV
jgi:hypothetical protein